MVVFLSGSSRNKQRYKNWKYNLLTDLKDYPVRGWMGSKKEVSNNTFRFCLFVCLKNWVKGAVVLWGREDWMVISLCSVYFSMLVLSDLSHSCVQCSPCHVTTFCTSWLTLSSATAAERGALLTCSHFIFYSHSMILALL